MKNSMVSDVVSDPVCDNNDTHLWMAVMDRAVRDLVALERYRQDPAIMEDPVFRYDYRTLKKWFHSTSMEPGSFNWICSLVNIDPKWALNRLEDRLKVCLVPESRRNRMRVGLPQRVVMSDLPDDELSTDELSTDEAAEAA